MLWGNSMKDEDKIEFKVVGSVCAKDLEEACDGSITPYYRFNGKLEFESGNAASILLLDRAIFLNACWWKKNWDEEARGLTTFHVNCNDVFSWGSSDAEILPYVELEDLYNCYVMDKSWGPAVWCIKQRGYMPQKPVYDAIQALGIWDLDKMNLEISVDDRIQKRKHEEEAKIQTSHLSFFRKLQFWRNNDD